ncbi:MAG: MoaD family protein [Chloroflexi bacterium]|nr:MoaD family protein [Chloroflexota bacterium]
MTVEVRLTANLQKLAGNQRVVFGEGKTVGELLDDLDAKFPGLKGNIVVDGRLHRFVNIYLNDEDIRFLGQLETPVAEGDVLSILPALAGGR